MPDDLLRRCTSAQISELMAYYRLEHEEHEAARKKAERKSK